MNKILLTLLTVVIGTSANAQESPDTDWQRPVTGFYRVEIGSRSDLATYLSPLAYSGTNVGLSGLWTKVLPQNPAHLSMDFDAAVNFASLLNRAGTASEYDIHASFSWSLMWQKRFPSRWMVAVGGNAGLYGGAVYLMRNSNNPVAAQFAVGVGARFFASYHFTLGRLPILFADRLSLPLLGGFFCPEYGEPYYEIYLGNRNGLAHFGWPGNRFGVNNLLSVTLDFGRTALEVGYRFSMQNEQANHLTTRFIGNAFVIGIIPGGIGLKKRTVNAVNALY